MKDLRIVGLPIADLLAAGISVVAGRYFLSHISTGFCISNGKNCIAETVDVDVLATSMSAADL